MIHAHLKYRHDMRLDKYGLFNVFALCLNWNTYFILILHVTALNYLFDKYDDDLVNEV